MRAAFTDGAPSARLAPLWVSLSSAASAKAIYLSQLGASTALGGLTTAQVTTAEGSIIGGQAVAQQLGGQQGAALQTAASAAFVSGLRVAMLVTFVIAALGAWYASRAVPAMKLDPSEHSAVAPPEPPEGHQDHEEWRAFDHADQPVTKARIMSPMLRASDQIPAPTNAVCVIGGARAEAGSRRLLLAHHASVVQLMSEEVWSQWRWVALRPRDLPRRCPHPRASNR